MTPPGSLDEQSFWTDLGPQQQLEITSAMRVRKVARDEVLIEQESPAHTLFIVNFGLFEVRHAADAEVVAEIGAGQLIGEIGFFAGGVRTASVVAARDSEVLEISRADFDALTTSVPELHGAVTRALGKRLARVASVLRGSVSGSTRSPTPLRMVVIVGAGSGEIPGEFVARLRKTLSARIRSRFLTANDAAAHCSRPSGDGYDIARWLADVERDHDLVVCVADAELTLWTQTALRSADQALLVADGSPDGLNPVEFLALKLFPLARRRLIRIEARRSGYAAPSAPWLRLRDVFMTHHVALQDDDDFDSLARFLSGQAIGYVAGGGGAFGPAHVAIFKAFREKGIAFDIHGGSSVGSAMAGTFSLLMEPDAINAATQEMFVRRRALKRFTFPRYGLLDHKVFDEELRTRYGDGAIEDAWKPYFAVATDLSTYSMRVMREGPLWQAIRASCAIPGVLPPFFDEAGHMLVDGGVIDNLPAAAMNSLKTGPNLIVDLRPLDHCIFNFDYHSIPGRRQILGRMFNVWTGRRPLPPCPGPASVILRSIFGRTRYRPDSKSPLELVLRPPNLQGLHLMNWDRHAEVFDTAYKWALQEIETLRAQGNPALAAMECFSRAPSGCVESRRL
jgi:NTE family protein